MLYRQLYPPLKKTRPGFQHQHLANNFNGFPCQSSKQPSLRPHCSSPITHRSNGGRRSRGNQSLAMTTSATRQRFQTQIQTAQTIVRATEPILKQNQQTISKTRRVSPSVKKNGRQYTTMPISSGHRLQASVARRLATKWPVSSTLSAFVTRWK